MEQSVERIIERNLLEVFNGRDADSRRTTIDELLLFTQFEGYVFSVRRKPETHLDAQWANRNVPELTR